MFILIPYIGPLVVMTTNALSSPLLRSVASAPGKIILFGEHAVVHDRPAVAVATSLRTTAHLEQLQDPDVVLSFPGLDSQTFTVPLLVLQPCFSHAVSSPAPCSPELLELLHSIFVRHASQQHSASAAFAAAVVPALYLLVSIVVVAPGGSHRGLRLSIHSDLPVGAGLGSSAAFSVSVAAAALELSAMAAAVSPCPSPVPHIERALVNDWAMQAISLSCYRVMKQ